MSNNIYSKYFNNSKNHNRVFLFGGNDIMMINDNIIEYYKDYDDNYKTADDIYENFIFGHTRIHIEEGEARLYFLDGKSREDIIEIFNYTTSYVNMKYGFDSITYYITENTEEVTKKVILEDLKSDIIESPNKYKVYMNDLDINKHIERLKKDTMWFYTLDDKHGELKSRISENVYSTFQ